MVLLSSTQFEEFSVIHWGPMSISQGRGNLIFLGNLHLFGNLILVAIPDISSLFRITARSI